MSIRVSAFEEACVLTTPPPFYVVTLGRHSDSTKLARKDFGWERIDPT
jgi:hypothetical protein